MGFDIHNYDSTTSTASEGGNIPYWVYEERHDPSLCCDIYRGLGYAPKQQWHPHKSQARPGQVLAYKVIYFQWNKGYLHCRATHEVAKLVLALFTGVAFEEQPGRPPRQYWSGLPP